MAMQQEPNLEVPTIYPGNDLRRSSLLDEVKHGQVRASHSNDDLDANRLGRVLGVEKSIGTSRDTRRNRNRNLSWRNWFGWWLSPTPLKNDGVRQLGFLFPIYGKIKNVPNHQPVILVYLVIYIPYMLLEKCQTCRGQIQLIIFSAISPKHIDKDLIDHLQYPLVICYIAIENGPVEIVDFPIEHGDFP